MVQEILPNIFRMEIPLPGNPLKAVNSYVIRGDGRFLIIDTGMNRKECREAMDSGLNELGVDLDRADFFITHLHADHMGLVSELVRPSSTVYFNHPDSDFMAHPGRWDVMMNTALVNGFPEPEMKAAMQMHPGRKYRQDDSVLKLTPLREKDRLSIGEYVFSCIETPGHTRGHMCLYEPRAKILFSGDHILGDITPNISMWSESENPLQNFLNSLEKVEALEVTLTLPGHRSLIADHRRRIAELKEHHENRANEVLSILSKGSRNVYQVAAEMTWDIDCKRWEDFPAAQKWFASGEAMSHLIYLRALGKISRNPDNGKVLYSL